MASILETPSLANQTGESSGIVFIGDSITAGYGLEREQAYPARIAEKMEASGLHYTVVNAGVSGDTTSGGLRRIEWVLRGSQPRLVFIALGGNDGLRGIPVEQTRANLRAMIERVRALSPETLIVLAGMRMPESMGLEYAEAFFQTFPKVAQAEEVALLPFLLEGVGGEPAMNQADQIHPNQHGQARIAETVWEFLKPLL